MADDEDGNTAGNTTTKITSENAESVLQQINSIIR